MVRIYTPLVGLFALSLLILAGCGSDQLAEITGKVTLDGQPLAGAEVNFEPVDPTIGTTGTGYTQPPDGSYKIFYPGDKEGAPAGEYKVWIAGGEIEDEEGGGSATKVPGKYSLENSPLTATVEAGKANVFDWELTSGP
jgi:hypothetical protein